MDKEDVMCIYIYAMYVYIYILYAHHIYVFVFFIHTHTYDVHIKYCMTSLKCECKKHNKLVHTTKIEADSQIQRTN